MDDTANLKLPLLMLDCVVQLSTLDRDITDAPAGAAEGDRYIVAAGATGTWQGRDGQIAAFQDGAWTYFQPQTGWQAWVSDENRFVVWDGSGWALSPGNGSQFQNLELLGIGTEADSQNIFSAKLNNALWAAKATGEGGNGDLRYTLNKEAPGNVLSLLMQSGWSGRAELGLVGSDDLSLKVSPDGAAWHEAISVDRASGIVSEPALPRFKAFTNYDNHVPLAEWTKIDVNDADYNDQNCFNPATNRFTAPSAGTYLFGASLLYKVNSSTAARMRGRLALNGSAEINGTFGEISGTHESMATALQLSTLVWLNVGDTVELQGYFREADGYFAANHTTFWGAKVG